MATLLTNRRPAATTKTIQTTAAPTSRTLSQARWGECYAITSMRKVELKLEFNFLSGSDFLFRVVRQMLAFLLLARSIQRWRRDACVV